MNRHIRITFDESEPVKHELGVGFTAYVDGKAISCVVTEDAMDDCFAVTSTDMPETLESMGVALHQRPVEDFKKYRAEVEAAAVKCIRSLQHADDLQVLIRYAEPASRRDTPMMLEVAQGSNYTAGARLASPKWIWREVNTSVETMCKVKCRAARGTLAS